METLLTFFFFLLFRNAVNDNNNGIHTGTYAASKAALTTASEILRLEMKPLGVRVLTVNSGLIKSNLTRNSPAFTLPPDSLYASIRGDVARRARMEDVALSGTEADVYAEAIVRDVLADREGTVWRGAFAETLRWMQIVLPKFVLVSLPDFLAVWKGSPVGEASLTESSGYDDDERKRIGLSQGLERFR